MYHLKWRTEQGYTGISTEDEYNEFLTQVGKQAEVDKLTKEEAQELEERFADSMVKDKVAQTFEAIGSLVTVGTTG
ncbi:winged helix-turn-helix domain-containing protein, partial [Bacillus toyonensis]